MVQRPKRPDRIDIRDWPYQPHLGSLPDQAVDCDLVPMILDQGEEGACTGFALAPVDPAIAALFAGRLVVAGEPGRGLLGPSRRESHGGFDNDPATLNSILRQILGGAPKREFEVRDLQY